MFNTYKIGATFYRFCLYRNQYAILINNEVYNNYLRSIIYLSFALLVEVTMQLFDLHQRLYQYNLIFIIDMIIIYKF